MAYSYSRVRVRRRVRISKEHIVSVGQLANKQLDRHIFRRWHNIKNAQRFAIGWIGLVLLLITSVIFQTNALASYYLTAAPTSGGIYTEGIVGTFSNVNPIYAVSDVDLAISKMLFDPLLTYNNKNQLVGDLADSWQVDSSGTIYTVHLKPDLKWQDGQPITAADVVFTYTTIQNPNAQSPYQANWAGVKIQAVNNLTVRFILPSVYSPFLYSLTGGIIPEHLLKNIPPAELRSASFNTESPVGSGPFRWYGVVINNNATQPQDIQLVRNNSYFNGAPKLDAVTLKTYNDENSLQKALNNNQIMAAVGLNLADDDIASKEEAISFNLMSANMLFLKTTNPIMSDVKMRQALIEATNVPALTNAIGYSTIPVREPLLLSQLGYNPSYKQFGFNKIAAEQMLNQIGWQLNSKDHFRYKNGQQLSLTLAYNDSRDYSIIASGLQKQWAAVGINLIVNVNQDKLDPGKFIDSHDYDVLLAGINIGPDPDVYVYWDSSQADISNPTHLNLSEYKSAISDIALSTARTTNNQLLRIVKYRSFLANWQANVPAIGLYQPRYLIVSNQYIYGLQPRLINNPSDIYNNINQWMIKTRQIPKS